MNPQFSFPLLLLILGAVLYRKKPKAGKGFIAVGLVLLGAAYFDDFYRYLKSQL